MRRLAHVTIFPPTYADRSTYLILPSADLRNFSVNNLGTVKVVSTTTGRCKTEGGLLVVKSRSVDQDGKGGVDDD